MAVRVRVQNFQSIEDVTIEIDGLTVITGTNNSGKTAVMRAIRGVFVNAPAGPLVRHGCAHLSVTISFDDGTVILWEKGWEKPNRKGKTINRYTVNGKTLPGVGRGVPPEVEALGVREISASSDRVWPQIASQFDGALFLVNRPGSAVAEALSDVERVGKLASALKASEKDRRAVSSELKIRRKDVKSHQKEVSRYDGLDGVGDRIRGLEDSRVEVQRQASEMAHVTSYRDQHRAASDVVSELSGFDPEVVPDSSAAEKLSSWSRKIGVVAGYRDRYQKASVKAAALSGFDPDVVPDPKRVEKLSRAVKTVTAYRDKRQRFQEVVDDLAGFSDVVLPESSGAVSLRSRIKDVHGCLTRLHGARGEAARFGSFSAAVFPTTEKIDKIRGSIDAVNVLWERFNAAHDAVTKADLEAKRVAGELVEAEAEVIRLLGDRGVCPTCNTIHEGGHA